MLVQVEIENFKSFAGRTVLSLDAGNTSKLPGNLLKVPDGRKIVKSFALYGANASGKTTVLDALYALASAVSFSSKDQKPTDPVPHFESFALDQIASARPATVSITFIVANRQYTYTVAATSERIWTEVLTAVTLPVAKTRKPLCPVTLISRQWDSVAGTYDIDLAEDEALGPPSTLQAVREQTPPNRLFLGKLASLNSTVATDLLRWFEEAFCFHDMHRSPPAEHRMLSRAAKIAKNNPDFLNRLFRLLKDADAGIEQLIPFEENVTVHVVDHKELRIEPKERAVSGLRFRHATQDGSEVTFRYANESTGTLRFIALLAAILEPTNTPRVYCVDEISSSLHPDLVAALIKVVHSSEFNPSGSQLLFTTHDTHLMDPKSLLRRDQIFLCTKNRFGASSLVRLDDFKDSARSDANLQGQYLANRFGGKPQFGPTLEDVQADAGPLEVFR